MAPVLMVQVSRAVLTTLLGRRTEWHAPDREGGAYAMEDLLRFHWIETLAGAALLGGTVQGVVSPWLLPIGFSLVLAAPISWLTARPAPRRLFATPESLDPPSEMIAARAWRESLSQAPESALIAAE
jgi:membrane glycosyltransferase